MSEQQDEAPKQFNAFEALMGHRKKSATTTSRRATGSSGSGSSNNFTNRKRRRASSDFVACPAGCGKHVLVNNVNMHLDMCIGLSISTTAVTVTDILDDENDDHVEDCELANVGSQRDKYVAPLQQSSPAILPTPPALSLKLFGASKKGRRSTCPICNSSLPTSLINLHLDQCVGRLDADSTNVADNNNSSSSSSSSSSSDTGTIKSSSTPNGELADDSKEAASTTPAAIDSDSEVLPQNQRVNDGASFVTNTTTTPSHVQDNDDQAVDSTTTGETCAPCDLMNDEQCSGSCSPALPLVDSSSLPSPSNQTLDEATSPKPNMAKVQPLKKDDCVGNTPDVTMSTVNKSSTTVTPSSPPLKAMASSASSVFAKMMNQSKVMAAREKEDAIVTVQQSFHLDENMRVMLRWCRNAEQEWEHPTWMAIVNLKERPTASTASPSLSFSGTSIGAPKQSPVNIDVCVSTSVPYCVDETPQPSNSGSTTRWVRNHSRLSVPVLKSILQKSIRRRRPLPSVRVAMELADKSLGDLLRRLPMIALEDSALHPDTDFVVWLMMAHSKDFVPPKRLMIRLFQIVYEIASCPWFDDLSQINQCDTKNTITTTTLASLIEQNQVVSPLSSSVPLMDSGATLWSLLVRAKYGGMRCDVDMLYKAATTWELRYRVPVPEVLAARLRGSSDSGSSMGSHPSSADKTVSMFTWSDVPTLIHQRGKEQGMEQVSSLCHEGLDRLVMEDVCVEGVDFHCSPIIEELLADDQLCGICFGLLILAAENGKSREQSSSVLVPENKASVLRNMFQKYMWKLSSSVNLRLPMLSDPTVAAAKATNDGAAVGIWNELLAPKAKSYQKNYVRQRLA